MNRSPVFSHGCLYKESRGNNLAVEAVWSCGKRGRGPVFQGLWEGPKEFSIGRQIPQLPAPCSRDQLEFPLVKATEQDVVEVDRPDPVIDFLQSDFLSCQCLAEE